MTPNVYASVAEYACRRLNKGGLELHASLAAGSDGQIYQTCRATDRSAMECMRPGEEYAHLVHFMQDGDNTFSAQIVSYYRAGGVLKKSAIRQVFRKGPQGYAQAHWQPIKITDDPWEREIDRIVA